jgi:hypothetical protein
MFAVPWRLNSKIFNHRILFMVMLRVLRPIRANRRTLPQAHRLVACAFTPLLALSMSLLKKITHPYPFRFLIICRSALRLPHLDTDAHSPRCCHALHPSPLARAPSRAPLAPSCCAAPLASSRRTRWCWCCSLRPSRAQPARLTQAWWWWRWCSRMQLVLDANGARATPLAAGSHLSG